MKRYFVARMVTDKEGKAVLITFHRKNIMWWKKKQDRTVCRLDPEAKEFEIAYKGQEVAGIM